MNIAATTVENYRKLKDAGIGTYILFQETYHKQSYLKLHPDRPEARLRLPHRSHGSCHGRRHRRRRSGRSVRSGDATSTSSPACSCTPSIWRLYTALARIPSACRVSSSADDIDPDVFDNGLSDEMFAKIIACIRIAVPYTGMIISTRESQKPCASGCCSLGVSQISGASRTSCRRLCEEEERRTTLSSSMCPTSARSMRWSTG